MGDIPARGPLALFMAQFGAPFKYSVQEFSNTVQSHGDGKARRLALGEGSMLGLTTPDADSGDTRTAVVLILSLSLHAPSKTLHSACVLLSAPTQGRRTSCRTAAGVLGRAQGAGSSTEVGFPSGADAVCLEAADCLRLASKVPVASLLGSLIWPCLRGAES